MTTTTETSDRTRLGTLRRFGYTLAIDYEADDDGACHFDLVAIGQGQKDEPMGTVTVTSESHLIAEWNNIAADIGIIEGSLFMAGIHRALRALAAALDGTVPLDPGHGFRPRQEWEYRIPIREPEAASTPCGSTA